MVLIQLLDVSNISWTHGYKLYDFIVLKNVITLAFSVLL